VTSIKAVPFITFIELCDKILFISLRVDIEVKLLNHPVHYCNRANFIT